MLFSAAMAKTLATLFLLFPACGAPGSGGGGAAGDDPFDSALDADSDADGDVVDDGGDADSDADSDVVDDPEICDGFDDDGNGLVDEGCECEADASQDCWTGPDAVAGVGACTMGTQTCVLDGEFPEWGDCTGQGSPEAEVCGDGADQDCDGEDEPCEIVDVAIDIDGDCVTAECPPDHPFPVGCDVVFEGGDSRGCVAYDPPSSSIYFQEGDVCNAGHLSGTITCSTEPGDGLDEDNCPINKDDPFYVTDPDDCPGDGGGPFGF